MSGAESGDMWVHLMSLERTGLLRLWPEGREVAFYDVSGATNLIKGAAV